MKELIFFEEAYLNAKNKRGLFWAIVSSLFLGLIELIGYFPFAWIIQQVISDQYDEIIIFVASFFNITEKTSAIYLLLILLLMLATIAVLSNYLLFKIIWGIYRDLSLRFTEKIFYSSDLTEENAKDKLKILVYEIQTVTHNYLLAKSIVISRSILVFVIIIMLLYINTLINGVLIFTILVTAGVAYVVVRGKLKQIGVRRLQSSEETFKIMTSIINTGANLRNYGPYKEYMEPYLEAPVEKFSNAQALNSFLPIIPRSVLEFAFFTSIVVVVALPKSLDGINPFFGIVSVFLFVRLLPIVVVLMRAIGEIAFSSSARDQLKTVWAVGSIKPVPCCSNLVANDHLKMKIKLKSTGDKVHCLTFQRSKLNVITGESGVGKTTILKAIQKVPSPNIVFADISEFEYLKVLVAPQKGSILSWASARDNLFINEEKMLNSNRLEALRSCLNLTRIDLNSTEHIESLSGGQEKRLDFMRTLIHESDIILLDEPTAGLDYENALSVINLLKQDNRTVIVVSHDENLIKKSDQQIVIDVD